MAGTLEPDVSGSTELERVREQRDYWRALFESVIEAFPEPILVCDGEGVLTHWNGVVADLTGIDPERAVGSPARELVGVDDGELTIAEQVVERGEPVRATEVRSGTSDAGERWHTRDSAAPLRDQDGNVVGAFEVATEVTGVVEQREELERLQQEISEQVLDAVEGLEESTADIADRSDEIADLTDDQSTTTDEIASEIANLSATSEEIASSVDEIAQHSSDATDLAEETSSAASESLDRMDEIASASDEVAEQVDELDEAISGIDAAVEALDEIADETNMLALNASIEAARSAESGDGFVVVADEMKSLAQQAGKYATEIDELVDRVQALSADATSAVNRTNTAVEEGTRNVREGLDRLEEISTVIDEIADSIDEVATATDEQAESAAEITEMVDRASDRADQVADAATEIADAIDQQRAEATEVRTTVSELGDDASVDDLST